MATAKTILNYVYYDVAGETGQQQVMIDGNNITSENLQKWNNRVVDLKESITLNAAGNIKHFKVSGISAFGAAVDESYSLEGDMATWKSTNESGSAKNNGSSYYLPLQTAGGFNHVLMQVLLNTKNNSVNLLPSGKVRLKAVAEVTLEQGKEKAQLTLYAMSGISFTPSYEWLDSNGHTFAVYSPWMSKLRKGWHKQHLDTLKAIQIDAEKQYLINIAKEQTHHIESPLLIKNINYLDVHSGKILKGQDVLINQGRIKKIARSIKVSKQTKIIDGSNQTMLPGLWDMHGHLSLEDGILNIASGVTGVRDIGNEHENITNIVEQFSSGKVIGTHVFRAGFIDKHSPYATKMGKTVNTLTEALSAVDWYADQGYQQIKLYSSITPEWVKPIAERTHQHGMRLSGHIPAFMTAEEAVEAGFDEIQHLNMVFLNFLGKNLDTRKRLRFTIPGTQSGTLDLNSEEVSQFIKLLKENNTAVDPTLAIIRYSFLANAGTSNVVTEDIAEHVPPTIKRFFATGMLEIKHEDRPAYQASTEAMLKMVKKLHDSGVQIIPGTDFIAGLTLHSELINYAQAGIAPADIIKLATIDSAKLMAMDKQTGSIEVGKMSDLVIINGNPLKNMSDIRKVSLVIKGNKMYQPDKLLQEVGVKAFTLSLAL